MLQLHLAPTEFWDNAKREFIYSEPVVLELEHSLASLSKWEKIFEKPFIGSDKTDEEVIAYVNCMSLKGDIPQEILSQLREPEMEAIGNYIEAKMSATWFSETPGTAPSRQIITSEIIYGWMIAFRIPFEAQFWHLNNLITQIRVLDVQQSPKKKLNEQTVQQQNAELNRQRRLQYNSKG